MPDAAAMGGGPPTYPLVAIGTWAADGGVGTTVLAQTGRPGLVVPHRDHYHVLVAPDPEASPDAVPWEITLAHEEPASGFLLGLDDERIAEAYTDVRAIRDVVLSKTVSEYHVFAL